MKRILIIFVMLSSVLVYSQVNRSLKHHAFSGTFMFGVEGGATLGLTDYRTTKIDHFFKGNLEYFFPTTSNGIFSIRGFAQTGYFGGREAPEPFYTSSFRTEFFDFGGGISYTFSIQDAVFPYIFLGGSLMNFTVKNMQRNPAFQQGQNIPEYISADYKNDELNYHGEVGLRFLLSPAINMNLGFGVQLSPHDSWEGVVDDGNNDLMLKGLVGISYSFFTRTDSDGDGIIDDNDRCPNTPRGVNVDDFGCPLDSDKDGVADYLDKCPNTIAGAQVNSEGCVVDSDQDGIADMDDRCPNTPRGVRVNEQGCPDTDNDGVFDNQDRCANTPAGAPVDESGCPIDSDQDGVPDFRDKCQNTPRGEQVDENGCSTRRDTVQVEKEVEREVTLKGDTNFEYGKANLLPVAHAELNRLAETMKASPNRRWLIEGHTDSHGSDKYNMDLSRRRADAVRDYLVGQGVKSDQIEILPKGESEPIANNGSPEGRAMNRRVVIRLVQ